MSQVFAPTRDGKAQMFRQALADARAQGDAGMVRAMRVELATLGVFETTQADQLEQVVPEKPRRGRRPKPRCEHGMIADRCLECEEA
jgi:hypothetical protein